MLEAALSAVAVVAALVSAGPGGAVRSADVVWSPSTLVFSGRGWGHGVGMSQWGAYGYARHGAGYRQILAHYYPGTTLGAAAVSRVRVLLAQGKKRLARTARWPVSGSSSIPG
jgi:stage II sporulation protein D